MSRTVPQEFGRKPVVDPDEIEIEVVDDVDTPPCESVCKPVSVCITRLNVETDIAKPVRFVPAYRKRSWSIGYIKRRKVNRKKQGPGKAKQSVGKNSVQNVSQTRKSETKVAVVPVKDTIETVMESQNLVSGCKEACTNKSVCEEDTSEGVEKPVANGRKMSVRIREKDHLPKTATVTRRRARTLSDEENWIGQEAEVEEQAEVAHSNQNEVSCTEEATMSDDESIVFRHRRSNNSSKWKFKRKRIISSSDTSSEPDVPNKLRKRSSTSCESTKTLQPRKVSNEAGVLSNSNKDETFTSESTNATFEQASNVPPALRNLRSSRFSYEYSIRSKVGKQSKTTTDMERDDKNTTTVFNEQDRSKRGKKRLLSKRRRWTSLKKKGTSMEDKDKRFLDTSTTAQLSVLLTRLEDMSNDAYVMNWRKNVRNESSDLTEPCYKESDSGMEITEISIQISLAATVFPEKDIVSSVASVEDTELQLESNDHEDLQEPPSIPQEMQATSVQLLEPDENMGEKYKLFRDPRVLLVKLESLGITFDNVVSASKVEELTQQHIEFLINSDLIRDTDRTILAKLSRPRMNEPAENNDEKLLDKIARQVALISSSSFCGTDSTDEVEDTERPSKTSKDNCISDSSNLERNTRKNQGIDTSIPNKVARDIMMVRIPMGSSPSKLTPSTSQLFRRKIEHFAAPKNILNPLQDIPAEEKSDEVAENDKEQSYLSSTLSLSNRVAQATPRKSVYEKHSSTSLATVRQSSSPQIPPRKATTATSVALSPRKSGSNVSSDHTTSHSGTPVSSPCTATIAGESSLEATEGHRSLLLGALALKHASERSEVVTSSRKLSMIKKRVEYTTTPPLARSATITIDSAKRALTWNLTDTCSTTSQNLAVVERTVTPKKNIDKNLHAAIARPPSTQKSPIRKDCNKHQDLGLIYKCIVCDVNFQDYSALQQHLSEHAEKQPETPKSPAENSTSTPKAVVQSAPSSSTARQGGTEQAEISTSHLHGDNEGSNETLPSLSSEKAKSQVSSNKPQSPDSSKEKQIKLKRLRRWPKMSDRTDCNICSKVFKTKAGLSNHIYTHTEDELQKAYAIAKTKINQHEGQRSKECEAQEAMKTMEERGGKEAAGGATVLEKAADVSPLVSVDDQVELTETTESPCEDQEDEEISVIKSPPKKTSRACSAEQTGEAKAGKQPQIPVAIPSSTRQNKVVEVTKPISVCECHKKEVVVRNSLKIEVVLLCHICRVLFRSMECFETHYRLPEHALCNTNRLNGRSPKLFCVTCGMIFSSVQDVRLHLQMHARSSRTERADFRCKICKVLFVGIGSLFYVHWSNHMKNPFFLASRLSFPKSSIIGTKLVRPTLTSTEANEVYLQVAEHVCAKCRCPFGVEEELKKHEARCTKTCKTLSTTSHADVTKVRLLCSICEDVFHTLPEFQAHVKNKHYRLSEPQYICVALTAIKCIYICNVCANTFSDMKEFEVHWATHDLHCQGYVCQRCPKEFKTWASFLHHSQSHKTGTEVDPPFCKAIYKTIKYKCGICKVMFNSPTDLGTHLVTHGLPESEGAGKENPSEEVTPALNIDTVAKSLAPKQPVPAQEKKIPQQRTAAESLIPKKIQKAQAERKSLFSPDDPKKNSDGVQQEKIMTQGGSKSSLNPTWHTKVAELDANYIKVSSAMKSNEVPNPEAAGSSVTTIDTVDTDSRKLKKANNTPSAGASASSSTATVSKENSPPKPKRGFLRVKTLAELTAKSSIHVCAVCAVTFESPDDLAQHSLIHNTQHDDDASVPAETPLKNVKLQQPTTSVEPESNFVPQLVPLNTVAKPTAQPTPRQTEKTPVTQSATNVIVQSTSTSIPVYQAVQRKDNVIQRFRIVSKNKQPLQLLSKVTPSTSTPSTSSSTAVYHKNLPACNITRPTTGTRCPPKIHPRVVAKKISTSEVAVLRQLMSRPIAISGPQLNTVRKQILRVASPHLPSTSGAKLKAIEPANSNPVPSTSGRAKPTVNDSNRKFVCALCPEFIYDTLPSYLNHELSPEHLTRKKLNSQQYSINQSNAKAHNVAKTTALVQLTKPFVSNSTTTSYQYQPSGFLNRGIMYVNSDSTANAVATTSMNFTGEYQISQQRQRQQQPQQVQPPQQYQQPPEVQQQQLNQQLNQQQQRLQKQRQIQLKRQQQQQQIQLKQQQQQQQIQLKQQQQQLQLEHQQHQVQLEQLEQQIQLEQQQPQQQIQLEQQQPQQQIQQQPQQQIQQQPQQQIQQQQIQQQPQQQVQQQPQQQIQQQPQQQIQQQPQQQIQQQPQQPQQQIQQQTQQQIQQQPQQELQLEQQQGQQQMQLEQQPQPQQGYQTQVYQQVYLQEPYMHWAVQPTASYIKANDEHNDVGYAQQLLLNTAGPSTVYQAPMVRVQYQPTEAASPTQQTIMYMCSYCTDNARYFSQERLQQHLNIEHNYLCDICGLRMFTGNDLDVHKANCMWQASAHQGGIPNN